MLDTLDNKKWIASLFSVHFVCVADLDVQWYVLAADTLMLNS